MYCQKKFSRIEYRDHLTNCEDAELTCQHCKGQFPKKQFQLHQTAQCEENYMSCARCQANFKRKYKDFHDCIRHLLNNQKTMQEQINNLKKEIEQKHNMAMDRIELIMKDSMKAEVQLLKQKMHELMILNSKASRSPEKKTK